MKENDLPVIPLAIGAGILLLFATSGSSKPKTGTKQLTTYENNGFVIINCDVLRFINIPKMVEYLVIRLKKLSLKPQFVVPSKIDIVDFCEDFLFIIAPKCYEKYQLSKLGKVEFAISYYIMYGALVNYFDNVLQASNPVGIWTKFFDNIVKFNQFRDLQYEKFDKHFQPLRKQFGLFQDVIMIYFQKINSGEIREISKDNIHLLVQG